MHQGMVRIGSHTFIRTTEYLPADRRTWHIETEMFKKLKADYKRKPLSKLSEDASEYEVQRGTNRGLAHQQTSSSPHLHLGYTDSTCSSRDHIVANAGNQDLGKQVALEHKNPGISKSQYRPVDASTSQTKKQVQSTRQLRAPVYSNGQRSKPMFSKNGRNPLALAEQSIQKGSLPNGYMPGRNLPRQRVICWPERSLQRQEHVSFSEDEDNDESEIKINPTPSESVGTYAKKSKNEAIEDLGIVYNKVLIVDNISTADAVVSMLTNQYKHFVHACDTEVRVPLELQLTLLLMDICIENQSFCFVFLLPFVKIFYLILLIFVIGGED